ncbi:Ankyrin repeat domain-containing protein, partial [Diplonema papillatum]
GWTPLHHAANTGNDDTVRLLLPYVRNANIQDYDGWTALHHAVASGCRQVVERLLLAGVDTEQRNMRGLKPAELTADVRIQRLLRKRRQPPPQQGCHVDVAGGSVTGYAGDSVGRYKFLGIPYGPQECMLPLMPCPPKSGSPTRRQVVGADAPS